MALDTSQIELQPIRETKVLVLGPFSRAKKQMLSNYNSLTASSLEGPADCQMCEVGLFQILTCDAPLPFNIPNLLH